MQFFKKLLRKILHPVTYYLFYRLIRHKLEVTAGGQPLKPGITAVVAAKNESYTISLCLKSLIGIVDQIVCIDNGSDDKTLHEMERFKKEFGNKMEVDILSLPDALLGDCRQAGLKATRYQWHLRWDADMICKTSGDENMIELRKKVLQDNTPRTIQLPRTNLIGDFHHTRKNGMVVDPGEPILVWYNKDIFYKEYGKFDTIRVPLYYKLTKETKRYYYHCAELKSVVNLLHRFHYFTWREKYNNVTTPEEKKRLENFNRFKDKRNQYLFDTNEPLRVKWRYLRQLSTYYTKFDKTKYGDYPEIIMQKIKTDEERFRVIYKDGKPYMQEDKKDLELLNYSPDADDLNWSIDLFFKKIQDEMRLYI